MSESSLPAESYPGRPGTVSVPPTSDLHHRWSPRRFDGERNRYARHDLGMALTSMMIEAMARGLVTHAMAGFDADAVRTAFAIPDDFDVVWTLALGHYDPDLEDPELTRRDTGDRRRRSLEDSLFGRHFGEPIEL